MDRQAEGHDITESHHDVHDHSCVRKSGLCKNVLGASCLQSCVLYCARFVVMLALLNFKFSWNFPSCPNLFHYLCIIP